MEIEVVGVHGHGRVFKLDDYFNAFALERAESSAEDLVEAELSEDAVEAVVAVSGNSGIVKQCVQLEARCSPWLKSRIQICRRRLNGSARSSGK